MKVFFGNQKLVSFFSLLKHHRTSHPLIFFLSFHHVRFFVSSRLRLYRTFNSFTFPTFSGRYVNNIIPFQFRDTVSLFFLSVAFLLLLRHFQLSSPAHVLQKKKKNARTQLSFSRVVNFCVIATLFYSTPSFRTSSPIKSIIQCELNPINSRYENSTKQKLLHSCPMKQSFVFLVPFIIVFSTFCYVQKEQKRNFYIACILRYGNTKKRQREGFSVEFSALFNGHRMKK